jgi:signal transduction histidine kinase
MTRRRIVFKLAIGWALFSTLLACILGYLSYSQTRGSISQNFNAQQLLLARQAAAEIERFVERLHDHLALVSSQGYADRVDALNHFQDFFTEEMDHVAAFFWLNPAGDVELELSSAGKGKIVRELRKVRLDAALTRFLAEGKGSPHQESLVSNVGISSLHVAMRLSNTQPDVKGVLVTSLDIEPLLRRFAGILRPTAKTYAWVLSSSGEIVFHDTIPELVGKDARVESRGAGNEGLSEIVENMLRRETGTGTYRYLGLAKNAAFAAINIPNNFYSIAVCSPVEELNAITRIGFIITAILFLQVVSAFVLVLYLTFAGRQEALQRSSDFAALWSVGSLRAMKLSFEELLQKSLEAVCDANNASNGWIYLDNPDTAALDIKASMDDSPTVEPPPAELLNRVFRGKELLPPEHPTFMVLVIPGREERFGVLALSFSRRPSYSAGKMEFLHLLLAEIGTSIESRLMLEELQSTSVQLARANEVKSRFASMVSHELRSPIAVISGYISLLKGKTTHSEDPDVTAMLDTIDQKAQHLDRMVNDLLESTRMEGGAIRIEPEHLKVRPFLEEVVHTFQPALQECGITSELDLPEELGPLFADRWRLSQVFSNLITNALKFTETGGHIVISAASKGDYLEFRVRDSGLGIPEEYRDLIFTHFYQAPTPTGKKRSGVGLGLAIVRQIVELHGGRIRCESSPGEGSTFIFTIPRRDQNGSGAAPVT